MNDVHDSGDNQRKPAEDTHSAEKSQGSTGAELPASWFAVDHVAGDIGRPKQRLKTIPADECAEASLIARPVDRGVVRSVDRATCRKALSLKLCEAMWGRPVGIGTRRLLPGDADVGPSSGSSASQLRLSQDRWQHRGDPWGLPLGVDEPLGYDNVPNEYRAFLAWGVDGVHAGLWIDDIDQAHPPYVVMASPMDFDDPIRLEAKSVEACLALVERGDTGLETAWSDCEDAAPRAAEDRSAMGLPPI